MFSELCSLLLQKIEASEMVQYVPTLSLFASWITHLWHPKSIPPICSIFLADWLTNLWWTVWDKLPRKLVIIYDIYLKIGYPIPSAGWPLFSSLKWPCLAPNEHQVCHQQQCIHLCHCRLWRGSTSFVHNAHVDLRLRCCKLRHGNSTETHLGWS